MAYIYETQYNSVGVTPAAYVPAVFGYPRKIIAGTIHHWGDKGQKFDDVRNFLVSNGATSAHYVAEAGRVACIVSPDDAAWHAGNAQGNAQTIGIECRPEATAGDYATVAELIADLRAHYGDFPLRPHGYWTATACPGDWDLARLDREARAITAARKTGAPSTSGDPFMAYTAAEQKEILDGARRAIRYLDTKSSDVAKHVWATPVSRGSGKISALQELADAKTYAGRVLDALASQAADIKALAQKEGLDPLAVERVLSAATSAALAKVSLTFTAK